MPTIKDFWRLEQEMVVLIRATAFYAYYYMADAVNTAKGYDEDPTDSAGGTEHLLYWAKDGGSIASTTNSPERLDATNAPGWYRVLITATESDCYIGNLYVKSPTSGITDGIRWFSFIKGGDVAPSAADVADAVWDELRSGHVISGSFGEALDAKISTVDDIVWDASILDHQTVNTLGLEVQLARDGIDNIDFGDVWDVLIADHDTDNTFGNWVQNIEIDGVIGPGGISVTLNIKDANGNAQADTEVWISTDSAGSTVVAGTKETDADGDVVFMLDEGTYYRWCQKTGADFDNPKSFTVVAE